MTRAPVPPDDRSGFLSRWSQRKVQARSDAPVDEVPDSTAAPPLTATQVRPILDRVPGGATAAEADPAASASTDPPPAPLTLDDVDALTPDADFSAFVGPGVDGPVRNAALKRLFTDPHYNVMDGLDTYIDDYGRPDPLPESMLRKMAQAKFLGLFSEEPDPPPPGAVAPAPAATGGTQEIPAPDEDPDLRLQPDDAAGDGSPARGAGEDPGGKH